MLLREQSSLTWGRLIAANTDIQEAKSDEGDTVRIRFMRFRALLDFQPRLNNPRYSRRLRLHKRSRQGLGARAPQALLRKFNFELQAEATEDNIVLSLTTAHSFDLAEVARYLNSKTVREILLQALLEL